MRRRGFFILICFIVYSTLNPVLAQGPSHLQASNQLRAYYVSARGNDNNPGTKNKPLKTIASVNRLTLAAGDTLYFRAGETFRGTLSLNLIGSETSPIIITSYGAGRATLNGGVKEAMILQGKHFILKNINAKGYGRKGGNTTNGIAITGADIRIEGIKTAGFRNSGLHLFNCKRAVVKNVTAIYNGFCGIYVGGTAQEPSKNIIIQDCAAINNPGDPSNLTNHSGNGILVGFSDSVLIDHCTATANGWDMPRQGNGPVGIWAYQSNGVIIQYCISYRNRTSKGGKDGGGFDFDGGITNSVIQYCLSYENEGAGYGLFQYSGASPWRNNTVRYCISINDATTTAGAGGIFAWNGAADSSQFSGCLVYHNLVYTTHAAAVQFEQESFNNNFCFYNNIFFGTGKIVDGPSSGERFAGNIWWPANGAITFRQYASLVGWTDSTGQEKLNGQLVGKQLNPLLRGPYTTRLTDPYKLHTLWQYQLQPKSPLRNQGLDLKTIFGIQYPLVDFYGNRVPLGNKPDPGIYELKD